MTDQHSGPFGVPGGFLFFFCEGELAVPLAAQISMNSIDGGWPTVCILLVRPEVYRSTLGVNTTEALFARNTMRLLKLCRMAEGANTSAKRGNLPYFRYFSWAYIQHDLLSVRDTQRNL